MKKVCLNVASMHCHSCEKLIESALTDLGALNAKADEETGTVEAEFSRDVRRNEVEAAIRTCGAGYKIKGACWN